MAAERAWRTSVDGLPPHTAWDFGLAQCAVQREALFPPGVHGWLS